MFVCNFWNTITTQKSVDRKKKEKTSLKKQSSLHPKESIYACNRLSYKLGAG